MSTILSHARSRSPRARLAFLVLALAPAFGAFAANPASAPMTKDQYRAEQKQIGESGRSALNACDAQAGNARDVCREEAKAQQNDALARPEADYTGKATDREKAVKVHAEGVYAISKEKCDDRKGNDKDVCLKEAVAARDKTLADLKAGQKAAIARNDAAKDKAAADYAVAKTKCDALAGADKDRCVADAKATYGQ